MEILTGGWAAFANPDDGLEAAGALCLGAGEQSGPLAPFAGRRLTSHAVVYVSSGAGSYQRADGSTVAVRAPAGIWLFPGVAHGYGPDARGWSEHWVLFRGPAAGMLESLGLIRPADPVVHWEQPVADVPALFSRLRDTIASVGTRAGLLASALTYQLVVQLAERSAAWDGDDPSPVVRAVARDAFQALPVSLRARRAGVSVAELRRVLRHETGVGISEFVLRIRLTRAQSLLAKRELSVAQVAHAVGYADPAYFSRFFTERIGLSPTAFRAQQLRRPIEG